MEKTTVRASWRAASEKSDGSCLLTESAGEEIEDECCEEEGTETGQLSLRKGENVEEAVANLKEAAELHIEEIGLHNLWRC